MWHIYRIIIVESVTVCISLDYKSKEIQKFANLNNTANDDHHQQQQENQKQKSLFTYSLTNIH